MSVDIPYLDNLIEQLSAYMESSGKKYKSHAATLRVWAARDRNQQKPRSIGIDDFGIERETDYTLEQIYNIVDSRYRNQRPLIVTTNLALGELKDPQDVAHARIYDRLLEMCVPICFTGENFRRQAAAQKMAKMQAMMKQERK